MGQLIKRGKTVLIAGLRVLQDDAQRVQNAGRHILLLPQMQNKYQIEGTVCFPGCHGLYNGRVACMDRVFYVYWRLELGDERLEIGKVSSLLTSGHG